MPHNEQRRPGGGGAAGISYGGDEPQHSNAIAEFNGARAGETVSVAPADTLLSLISRATAALEGARTLAETVQAMKLAQAAKELGRIVGAANEARADCLRVELLAQMRIAREYAGAQVRGEVAKADGTTHHRPKEGVPATDTLPATIDYLGLDRRRRRAAQVARRQTERASLQ